MILKKDRIPVVFDTNLFITRFIRHNRDGLNRRVIDLWQEQRKLQLILSQPIRDEYLLTLERRAQIPQEILEKIALRLDTASYVTCVNLGKRFYLSRDPKDNMLLDTAHIGKAKYLITRDNDLLDTPAADLQGVRFQILTPFQFLNTIGELS